LSGATYSKTKQWIGNIRFCKEFVAMIGRITRSFSEILCILLSGFAIPLLTPTKLAAPLDCLIRGLLVEYTLSLNCFFADASWVIPSFIQFKRATPQKFLQIVRLETVELHSIIKRAVRSGSLH